MGGRRPHHPRRGSLAYHPRKRAKRPVARVRAWAEVAEGVKIGGFPCYKAGTTHVEVVDDSAHSITSKQPIATVATVLEAPPIRVFGIRAYRQGYGGLETVTEVFSDDLDKELARVFPLPKKKRSGGIEKIEKMAGELSDIRLLVHTQPKNVPSLPKKKPEVLEMPVAGATVEEKMNAAKELLGKEIRISEVFKEGDYVDTKSITKGKGFQGPLKKWGVKHLPPKTRKGHRTAGTLGPWHPSAMMWTVPQSGQMGYHQRTEYNKRVLKIGSDGGEVTPKGGFLHYGVIKNDYIIIKGSTPGPQKRFVMLRPAIRLPKDAHVSPPEIVSINTGSMQGV
ncbi:MAG: 50S ribosomal protein L3 [Methanobacteriota archaeon]|nr:MAG: 50S ribosomal protein L3 [Euryarchaeota archaeon]